MTVEELNTKLYERMFEEQEQFRSELLGKSPQEAIITEATSWFPWLTPGWGRRQAFRTD